MQPHRTPGVHVESAGERFKPMEAVRMGTCAFLGRTPQGPSQTPVRVDSFERFRAVFGDDGGVTSQAVRGFFDNGGVSAYVVNIAAADGGLLRPDDFTGIARGEPKGLRLLEGVEAIDLVAAPELVACHGREPSFRSLDTLHAVQAEMVAHCERMHDRFALLDPPPDFELDDVLDWRARFDTSYAALYYPWVVPRIGEAAGEPIPPSGHVAGLFARCDHETGVHRAPANLPLHGLVDVAAFVHKRERDRLFDAQVNGIHAFTARGLRVWGSRTLSSDRTYAHVNVRRLVLMLRRSIDRFAQWVVFEPNDESLWKTLTRSIEAFLFEQFKRGALVGATAQEAFYVKCDAETNSPEAIEAGELVVEIGIAAVRPAEFIVVRIHQWTREASPEKTLPAVS